MSKLWRSAVAGGLKENELDNHCSLVLMCMTEATFDHSTAGPQLIIALQLLLLRLRHCAKCDCTEGNCTYSPQCPETKELWSHILECSNPACPRPGCQEAVQILKHHQGCRQQCPICSPARCIMDLIKNQPSREGFLTGQEGWGEERTILDRMNKLYRAMEVLEHTSACFDPYCTYDCCAKGKELFQHAVECTQRSEGGCIACRRLWGVLQLHSRQCRLTDCPVPRCQDLRNMARRRQEFRNARKFYCFRMESETVEQPQGIGRSSAAPPRQPPAIPWDPAALGESMLRPSSPATAAFKKVAGSVEAVLEDVAKLPAAMLPADGKGKAYSKALTPILAHLQRQLTSDLAAPTAHLLTSVQRLASAPEYRGVFVGQPRSGKSSVLEAFKQLSPICPSQQGASSIPVKILAEGIYEHEAMVAGVTLRLVDTPGHLGGPSSNTRQELENQLQRADAVFFVLDYNSLDASLEWGLEHLAWLKPADRVHVVVNKVEDTSLLRSCENEQEAVTRVHKRLVSRGLPLPISQVWLLSASEARLCMSIRLRQAGLLRQVGDVQDKLFRLMVWGRKAPAAISDAEYSREVDAAFAKSGLGSLGRQSVALLHKRVGSQKFMDKLQSGEGLLSRAWNSCLVSVATVQVESDLAAQPDQQEYPDKAAGNQLQQPCLLPQLVVMSLHEIIAWTRSSGRKEKALKVTQLQPLMAYARELRDCSELKRLVGLESQRGADARKELSKSSAARHGHTQGGSDIFKCKLTTMVGNLYCHETASLWTANDRERHAEHCKQYVRHKAGKTAGIDSRMQSQDQTELIRKVAEAIISEDLLGLLLQQGPLQMAWQEVLEEARRDLQNSLLRLLTRQPSGMEEYVSELANLCRSLPASGRVPQLGMKAIQEVAKRLAEVSDSVTAFQKSPLPHITSSAQQNPPEQQQHAGGQMDLGT